MLANLLHCSLQVTAVSAPPDCHAAKLTVQQVVSPDPASVVGPADSLRPPAACTLVLHSHLSLGQSL